MRRHSALFAVALALGVLALRSHPPRDRAAIAPSSRPATAPWWDYSAAPIFVPVEQGNPLGTPGTATVGTAGTSTLGTSGTRTLGTSGTSTLGTAGTSTVGSSGTTRASSPQPSR